MIDLALVTTGSTAVYAVALVVLLVWLRRVPVDRRTLCYPIVLIVGTSAVAVGLNTVGVGLVTINGYEVTFPTFLNDLFSYALLYFVMARIGGIEGRPLALVVATPVAQRVAFELGVVFGGLFGLAALGFVIVAHLAIAAYLLGPIWRSIQSMPEQRRLLHWKARNLVLFLMGMLIVYALISVGGIFDTVTSDIINQYMGILIRVGFAGFLFTNLDAVGGASLRPSARETGGATAD